MSEFINLNKKEFDNFLGNITLYSLNELKSLGDNVNISYKKTFVNNTITYFTSLAQEALDDLIIIDGDDFNPSKIFGLTKKYYQPIVIFISNSSKIDKLKNLLLREVLIINKNTLQALDISKEVANNIEIKKQKDLEKQLASEENKEILEVKNDNSGNQLIENKKDVEEVSILKENDVKENKDIEKNPQKNKKEELLEAIDVISLTNEELKVNKNGDIVSINGEKFVDLRKNKEENYEEILATTNKKENNKLNKKEEVLSDDDILLKQQIEKKVVSTTKSTDFTKKITNKDINISNVGIFGLNIEMTDKLKEMFDKISTIRTTDANIFDFYILDISFATERVFKFIQNVLPMPMVLTSIIPDKFDKIPNFKEMDILVVPKPLTYTLEEFEQKVLDYLNNYNLNKEKDKKNKLKEKCLNVNIGDKEDEFLSRRKYDTKVKESRTPGTKPTPEEVKQTKETINKLNQRFDKELSLSKIYESLGLNKLAMYDSQINKKVYHTYDGKIIEYKPNGYLVEIRLKRLKGKGLSEKEIGSAMQRLEESDISFERKQLQRLEKYKMQKQNKENALKNKS